MTANTAQLVQKLWNHCSILDDRLSYGDYIEQLTFLLFLQKADDLESALDQFRAIEDDLHS